MCLFLLLVFFGPRIGILFWWLAEPGRWETAFSSVIFPVLGFIFLPWTTLMFVAVAPFGNVAGWDWFWLALSFFFDLANTFGNIYGNRSRIPSYA